jgi:hypothetical protein
MWRVWGFLKRWMDRWETLVFIIVAIGLAVLGFSLAMLMFGGR